MKQLKQGLTEKLLKRYKVNLIGSVLVKSRSDFINKLDKMQKTDFPVVLKAVSEQIIHKSDIGGVVVGIPNKEEALKAYDAIYKNIKKKMPRARFCIAMQKMVSGVEVIAGSKIDPDFGPVIVFGAGGILVELVKDISFRIAPLEEKDVYDMINETKVSRLLHGFRGSKEANIKGLADIILNLSRLAAKNEKIKEIDLNPIIVSKDSAVVVDARIMV